jgi:putative hydrolase of the HAD superfamily
MQSHFCAVIFDFGGVMTSSPFEAFNRYEAQRGLPLNTIRRINAANPDGNAWALFERAQIDGTAFDTLFAAEAAALGHDIAGADVLGLLAGDIRPAMVTALMRIKDAGLVTGCITNNVPTGSTSGFIGPGMAMSADKAQAVAEIMTQFDHILESSKIGIRKPDPRIYQMMCDALNIPPEHCIYLDDLGINCKPAAALGMHAIKVVDERQALADLSHATGLDLV